MNRVWLDDGANLEQQPGGERDESGFDLSSLLALVRRRIVSIIAVTVLGISCGVGYLFLTKPIYSASALVLIDPRKPATLSEIDTPTGNFRENLIIDSEIEVIKSNELMKRAVKKLSTARFKKTHSPSPLSQLKGWVTTQIGLSKPQPTEAKPEEQSRAYLSLKGGLNVRRVGRTYAIRISYVSTDPKWAAQAANAIAQTYLVDKLETRFAAAKHANDWLRTRVDKLSVEVIEAERAVELYKTKHKIVSTTGGQLVTDQQLTELNSRLIVAKAEAAGEKARLDRITEILETRNADAAVEGVLSNEAIIGLRTELGKWSRVASRMREKHGPTHLAYKNARGEMRRIQNQIIIEVRRVAESYDNSYQIAQSRVKSLEDSMAKLANTSTASGHKQLKLRELERQAKSLRGLYTNLLESFGKSNVRESVPAATSSNTRIIENAEVPTFPTAPNPKRVLLLSLLGGLAAGVSLAYLRSMMDRYVWTPADLEKIFAKRSYGMMPALDVNLPKYSKRNWRNRLKTLASSGNDPAKKKVLQEKRLAPFTGILSDRFGHISEVLRNVYISVNVTAEGEEPHEGAKVLSFVSTLQGEGKSTCSILQAIYQAQNGAKTLLIDADFRKPSLTQILTPEIRSNRPNDDKDIAVETFVHHDDKSGLDFLPVFVGSEDARPADLILRGELAKIIEKFRSEYEYIVLDLPPLLVLPDARFLVDNIDSIIYVVEWGKIKREAIAEAIKSAPELQSTISGSIFNKVDMNKVQNYGYHYYGSYYYK